MARAEAEQTLTEAVATGDRRQALEALRAHLAQVLEEPHVRCADCGGSVPVNLPVAAVAKELRAVVDELEKAATPEGSKIDELKAKREARHDAAPVRARAKGGKRRSGPGSDRAG